MAFNNIQDTLISAMTTIAEGVASKNQGDTSVYVLVTDKNNQTNTYTAYYNGIMYDNVQCVSGSLNIGDKALMTIMANNKKVLYGNTDVEQYSSGTGIDINNKNVSVKIDNDTIKVDSQGNLYAEGGGSGGESYHAGQGISISEHNINVNVDNNTIVVGSDNKLKAINSGASYVAGNGIDINNNTISVKVKDNSGLNISNDKLDIDASKLVDNVTIGVNNNGDIISKINCDPKIKGGLLKDEDGLYVNVDNSSIKIDTVTGQIYSVGSSSLTKTGSPTQGIYIDTNGVPQVMSYALNKTVPSNAVFTDTKYTAGNGLTLTNTVFSADTEILATKSDIENKQDKLSAVGSDTKGIYINADGVPTIMRYSIAANVPSDAKFTDTKYSAGNGLTLTNTTFAADTNILATKTELSNKQDILIQGDNITINDNVISAENIVYTAGEGLKENENEFIVTGFATQSLTATTDFNNVITNGVYSCPTVSSAETYNRPTTAIGILEVKEYNVLGENKLIVQIFHRGSSSYNESYIRRKYTTGDWGQWNSFINQLGEGLTIDSIYNKAKIDYTTVQKKLTAGNNINLDSQGNISAINTTYTAGSNINIDSNNIISATDTTYNDVTTKTHGLMTASDKTKLDSIEANADVSNDGVLTITQNGTSKGTFSANQNSAKTIALTDTTYTAGSNIQINNNVISATDTVYSAGSGLSLAGNSFSVDTNTIATKASVDAKQDRLTQTGTSKKGIYINSNGVPTVMTYSVEANVPQNAVFTDTTYSAGNGLNLSGTTFNIDYSDEVKEYNRVYTTGKNIIGKLGATNIYGNAPTQHFNSNSTASYVYIEPTGDDVNGNGTSTNPFRTLQTAFDKTLNNGWTDCRVVFKNFTEDTEMILTRKNIHEATIHLMNQSNALITIKFSSSGASGKPAFYNVHFNFDGKFNGGTGGFKVECATEADYTYVEGGTFVYKDTCFANKVVSFGAVKGIYENCIFDGGVDISAGCVRLINCIYNQPELINGDQAKYMVYIRDGANVNIMGSTICNSSRTTTASNTSCAFFITEAQAIFDDACTFTFNKAVSTAVNFQYCLGLRNGQVHIPQAILTLLKNNFGTNIYKKSAATSLINTGLSELPASGGGGTTYSAGEGLDLNDNIFSVDYTKTQKILSAADGLSLSNDTINLASKSYTTSTFPWRDTQNGKDVPSFNKAYQEGTYALSLYGAGDYSSVANTVGFPLTSNSTIYGELIVSRAYSTSRYVQIYIYAASSTASYRTRIFFRNSYNNTGSWKAWREVASLDDIDNININNLSLDANATDFPWWTEPVNDVSDDMKSL